MSNSSSSVNVPGGDQLPGYELLEKLGAGAKATVYKSRQQSLDRVVAIKVIRREPHADAVLGAKTLAEARAAAKLNHPNIVQAFDVGQTDATYFFVMEYVPGTTVHQRVQQQGRYSFNDGIRVIMQVAQALHHAHSKKLLHCDVKPQNIIITSGGIAKLADLGLARRFVTAPAEGALSSSASASLTASKPFGTPYYISPEQIRGEQRLDERTDIYSLGATFYYMLTGRVPFEGASAAEVYHHHLSTPLTPPERICSQVPTNISVVIEKMMEKDPNDRYASMVEFLEDIQAILTTGLPVHAKQKFAFETLSQLAEKEEAVGGLTVPPKVSLWQNPLVWALGMSLLLNVLLLLMLFMASGK